MGLAPHLQRGRGPGGPVPAGSAGRRWRCPRRRRTQRGRGARAAGRWRRRDPAGATVSRSSSASASRRVTCGERAPTRRSSSNARRTYASQSITGTMRRTDPLRRCGAVRERSPRELAQTVVQAVDRLDRGGRVEKRRVGERPLRDVDEHAQAVRDVLVERSLQREHHAARTSSSRIGRSAPSTRRAARRPARSPRAPACRTSVQSASRATSTSRSWPRCTTTPEWSAQIGCCGPAGTGGP